MTKRDRHLAQFNIAWFGWQESADAKLWKAARGEERSEHAA